MDSSKSYVKEILKFHSRSKNMFLNLVLYFADDIAKTTSYGLKCSKNVGIKYNNTIAGHQATQATFRNCPPFSKCNIKIDGTTIEDAEDAENLDLVMLMYNQIEYSSNYYETRGSLWFYSKDEATNFNAGVYGFTLKMK